MGLQIRDERQMKALTGLSQAQFDSLLPSMTSRAVWCGAGSGP